jgi:hypothetical protein
MLQRLITTWRLDQQQLPMIYGPTPHAPPHALLMPHMYRFTLCTGARMGPGVARCTLRNCCLGGLATRTLAACHEA